jgi:hypothetical protein
MAEELSARVERAPVPAGDGPAPRKERKETSDPLTDFLASRQGRRLQREVLRGVFSLVRKRL